jgi:HEAT repeat protein
VKLHKPSFLWIIGLLAVAILALLGWVLIPMTEPVPVWQGRTIHYWMAEFSHGDKEADHALVELDAAALPTLRRYARARDTAITRTKIKHWSKLPAFLQNRLTPPVSAATLRERATHAYRLLGATAALDTPLLIRLLEDADPEVGMSAAYALGEIGVKDSVVVAALVAHASHTNLNMRSSCIYSLGNLRVRTPAAFGVLTNALRDLDGSIRQAAFALYRLHAQDAGVIAALIHAVRRESFRECSTHILALAETGPAASNAVPALLKVLETAVRTNDWERTVRFYTVKALGAIGPPSSAAVPKLRELRNDPQSAMRVDAAVALWRITGQAEEALFTLTESKKSQFVSDRSLEALGRMGTNALPALPFIVPYLTNPAPSLRLDAATTAWQIAPERFPSPLPALTNALSATTNDYPKFSPRGVVQLRLTAAFRLGKLGASARAALPALRAARKTPDWELRQAIDWVLDDIEMAAPPTGKP